jgi:hypothetical protein
VNFSISCTVQRETKNYEIEQMDMTNETKEVTNERKQRAIHRNGPICLVRISHSDWSIHFEPKILRNLKLDSQSALRPVRSVGETPYATLTLPYHRFNYYE